MHFLIEREIFFIFQVKVLSEQPTPVDDRLSPVNRQRMLPANSIFSKPSTIVEDSGADTVESHVLQELPGEDEDQLNENDSFTVDEKMQVLAIKPFFV